MLAVAIGLAGSDLSGTQRRLIAWFGIRGIGSIYYLMFAIEHGLTPELAQRLTALVFPVLAASILVHGISVTPLMSWYERKGQQVDEPQPSQPHIA